MMYFELLETEDKWRDYCKVNNIINPFDYNANKIKRVKVKIDDTEVDGFSVDRDANNINITTFYPTNEDIEEYLRLKDKFFAWDGHFWMSDWEQFRKQFKAEGYVPCDLVGRQCYMACEYFGKNCLREREELKCPIFGLEENKRWEIKEGS